MVSFSDGRPGFNIWRYVARHKGAMGLFDFSYSTFSSNIRRAGGMIAFAVLIENSGSIRHSSKTSFLVVD